MSSNEWESLGESIHDLVQSAVDSKDFAKLSQSIRSAVNITVNEMEHGINLSSQKVKETIYGAQGSVNKQENRQNRESAAPKTDAGWSRPVQQQVQTPVQNTTAMTLIDSNNRVLFAGTTKYQVFGGIVAVIMSPVVCGLFLSTLIMLLTFLAISGSIFVETIIILLLIALTGGSFALTRLGLKAYSQGTRFKKYIAAANGREYVNLDQLAKAVNKRKGFVRKDIQRMLDRKWFRQGHWDEPECCLMITDRLYQEYLYTQKQARELQQEEERRREELRLQQKAQPDNSRLSTEEKEVLAMGKEFICKIRKCNNEIPGEEISEKISKIETIVQRILQRVELHPENIPDIRKMLDYYLPTTVKLLEAYSELDDQPVQGANIATSKREIEDTLDTLNVAFEKLLDELFRDTAWDVSTDISVLQTMLAQEGLTEKDF